MDDQELQDFTLEDIIKEFSADPTQPVTGEDTPEELPLQDAATTDDAAQVFLLASEIPDAEPPDEASAAEEESPAPAPVTGDTIRMDTAQFTKGLVRNAQPIEDEEDEPPIPTVPEQTTEPYSAEWEPEYEQPISEYVPPRPIIFHPRSKMRELKRKLVAGPEKQYYALSEKGLGTLQAAIFFSGLVTLISTIATAMFALGLVQPERTKLIVFGQFLAMLICALLGSNQLLEGLTDLKSKRFSLNTLLCFSFLLCCADGVMGLWSLRVPCCAAFSLQMTMSLWSTYEKRNTALGQLDTMRKATHLYGLALSEDYCQEGPGLLRTEGKVEDFMSHYQAGTRYDKPLSIYALVALGVSIAAGVLAGMLHGIELGIQVSAVTCLAALPASMFVTLTRPMAILERRLHSLGSVICGWNGVENMSKKVLFPITHEDLFPAGSVKLNGVKFYGDRESDQVVAYCAALVCADNGALVPIFEHLLDSRNGIHYPVDSYQAYANGGIGGQVNGEPVLVGTLSFLQEMGVQIPEGIRLSHAVGVSIDGTLCGLFALAYDKIKPAAAGLGTLCSYRGLRPTLTSGDFMLTEAFLKNKFGVNTKRIFFPEYADRLQLQQAKPGEDATTLAIAVNETLAPLAYCITGSRAVSSAAKAGVIAHMICGIVGMGIMLVLAVLGAQAYLTPANMFLYQLVWMIPGLLITKWSRSI